MLDYMVTLQKYYRVFYKKNTFESIQSEIADTLAPRLEVNVTTGPVLLETDVTSQARTNTFSASITSSWVCSTSMNLTL